MGLRRVFFLACLLICCSVGLRAESVSTGIPAEDDPFGLNPAEFIKAMEQQSPYWTETELDSIIQLLMDANHIPGLQAVITLHDSIVWTGSYGYMDADLTIPVTDSTLFILASITKTVLSDAILQCVENGLIELDSDISNYLPFVVDNPRRWEGIAITPRMIMSHVSSIARNDTSWIPDMVYGHDWDGDFTGYLENYLVPGGSTYVETNYLNVDPGEYFRYSNYAYALLAAALEQVTGMSVEQYTLDSIFQPMEMYETAWWLRDLDTNRIAMPLRYNDTTGSFVAYGHVSHPLWPIGQLRTTASQLAAHSSLMANHGRWHGHQVLDSATVVQIMTHYYPDTLTRFNFGWQKYDFSDGPVWGHDGSLPGCGTALFVDPHYGNGVIILTNVDFNYGIYDIFNTVWDFARDLDRDEIFNGADNCSEIYNPGQEDADGDGIGDACCCGVFGGGYSGNVDCDSDGKRTLSDITRLIDRVYLSKTALCCPIAGNIDGDLQGLVNLADITKLIDHIYLGKTATAPCP